MTSVTYTFNLDPVASTATRRAATADPASATEIGAKYQAVQAGFQSDPALSGIQSPACAGGDCFVLHGDGPGVTTLSIGEEGGATSDFLALPVVDGAYFMEPPVTSFASAGDYEITTLAIGEEDGGMAVASSEIGVSQPDYGVVEYVEQATLDPMPMAKPAMTAEAMPMVSSLPPIETTPILEPRVKPAEVASAGAPLPDLKPNGVPGGVFAGTPMPDIKPGAAATDTFAAAPLPEVKPEMVPSSLTTEAAPSGENFVSVGDYDSYLASLGTEPAAQSAITVPETESATAPAATNATTESQGTAALHMSPPPAPPEAAPAISGAPARVEMTFEPAMEPTGGVGTQGLADPVMQPATFTTTPTVAAPQAIATTPIPAGEPLAPASELTSPTNADTTFSTADTPFPSEKPPGMSMDAPRLSQDDLKITTLALGEEDAGGG